MTDVKLAWSPAADAPTTHLVQYRRHDTVPEAWTNADQPSTEPEFTVGRLISGVAYDFRVAAVNNAGQGLYGPPSSPRARCATRNGPIW